MLAVENAVPDPNDYASRRGVLQMLAAVPLAAIPAAPAAAVRPAKLVQTIGVCVHLNDTGSAYHDWNMVRNCLEYIGLRHMRTAAPQRATLGYGLMGRAAAAGYKFTFTMRHNRGFAEEIADLEAFAQDWPGSIAAIEGPNEIDHAPVTFNGRKDLKTDAYATPVAALGYQAALYQAIRGSPLLSGIPLIAFSDFAQGQQRADFSNTHIYPRNGTKLSANLAAMHKRLDPAGRQIMITETGFHTLPDAMPFPGTDEATQASLIEDAITAAPLSRVARTFLYELIDSYPPNDDMETHFGLFRYDYSAKMAASTVRRLVVG